MLYHHKETRALYRRQEIVMTVASRSIGVSVAHRQASGPLSISLTVEMIIAFEKKRTAQSIMM